MVRSERFALPATRFAVGAYVRLLRRRTKLEAVASSLTELFSPLIIGERVPAMLARYAYVTRTRSAYFDLAPSRRRVIPNSRSPMCWTTPHAAAQQAAIDALVFKCDILWASSTRSTTPMARPDSIPPGAFRPGDQA